MRLRMGIGADIHANRPHDALGCNVVVLGGGDDTPEPEGRNGVVDHHAGCFAGIAVAALSGDDGPKQAYFGVAIAVVVTNPHQPILIDTGDKSDGTDDLLGGGINDGALTVGGLVEVCQLLFVGDDIV
jgi:hypothetical protein